MPIYEYRCGKCGHAFEELVYPSTEVRCPSCSAPEKELEKQFSVFAVSAKGEGAAIPEGCRGCGHPGGPGSCGMS
ncbi:MAG: zinc ribbon domain-containing protein [Deltaproteobacteria bacterium]|nr:zinc ribbon domain-containing protein [Deltaproteobacteria bacterium]